MTQEELDALPEVGAIGQTEMEVNGRRVVFPVFTSKAMWDAHSVIDEHGQRWMIGVVDGVLSKQRMMG